MPPSVNDRCRRGLVLVAVIAMVGCAEPGSSDSLEDATIPFSAVVGDEPLRCDRAYEGVGSSSSRFELKGLLAFVHGVEVLTASGDRVAVELVDDGHWQGQGIARLDFEDGTGTCMGDEATNEELRVRAPAVDEAVGLAFRVGVPAELNHLDAATVGPPLDDPTAWWGWKAGFVFVQLTIATPLHDFFYAHVGATGCEGSVDEGFSCADEAEILVELDGFELGRDGVHMDLAALLGGVDLEAPLANDVGDHTPGCMSTPPDAECEPIFGALGLSFDRDEPGPPQVVFALDPDAAIE